MAMRRYDDYDQNYGGHGGGRHGHHNRDMQVYQQDPFGIGFGDVFQDVDRQFRQMNRELQRMERQLSRGEGTGLGSMVDRTYPILPQFVDENGRKAARFHFDVSGFKPEDVSIKTREGRIEVTARHEDKGDDHHAIREFRRMVTIPEGMQMDQMRSRLTPNGVLTIEAPFNPPAIQHDSHMEIPIHHEGKKAIGHNQNQNQNK